MIPLQQAMKGGLHEHSHFIFGGRINKAAKQTNDIQLYQLSWINQTNKQKLIYLKGDTNDI